MSDFWERLSNAASVGERGIVGIAQLQEIADTRLARKQAGEAAVARNILLQQKMSQDAAIEQAKLTTEALKTRLTGTQDLAKEFAKALADNPSLAEDKDFMDTYSRSLLEVNNATDLYYQMLGVPRPKTERSLDIVRHLRSIQPPAGRPWSPEKVDLIKRTYENADIETIQMLWESMDSSDKELAPKEVSDDELKPRLSGAGLVAQGIGGVSDLLLDIAGIGVTGAKSIWEGKYSPAEFSQGDPVSDYLEGLLGVRKIPSSKAIQSALESEGTMPDVSQDLTMPGETASLIPLSDTANLNAMDNMFGGTGGMMSFAKGLELSPKAKKFLEDYISLISEMGEDKAKRYLVAELSRLSKSEQKEVLDAIEELSQ